MVLYYENGIRAGITWAICHCTEGNNKYIYMFMMKQTKVHVLSILISIINTKGIYQNHFITVNLNILKIHQCMHLSLSYTKKKQWFWLDINSWCWLSKVLKN